MVTSPNAEKGRVIREHCDRCGKDTTYVSMWPWRQIWLCSDCYDFECLIGRAPPPNSSSGVVADHA